MTEKMLYVRSNDYWGYDASDFDSSLNFYKYTWVVPEAMYNDFDDADKSRLFPCALFYVQGVTDNHNFLTISVKVDGDVATVKGMQGPKRRTRKFEIGVPFSYEVGSLSMKEAPAGSDNVSEIETAVKDGTAKMTGSFIISQFLTDAESIAEAVGLTEASEAESYVAPADEKPTPSGFLPDSSATNPMEESFSAEIDAPPMNVSDFYPQSSAEIGNEASGRGVPISYGSGSSQYVEPPVVVDEEMAAEEIDAPGQPEIVSDFYPQSSAEIGEQQSGRGVPVSYGSGSSQYVEPPVVMDDDYMQFEATGEPDEPYDEGYDDEMDESLGMRDGSARTKKQGYKARRDEAAAMDKKYGMKRKYDDVETMDAEIDAAPTHVSDFYPQSSAEIGDVASGRGVPVAYGSGSSQYIEPPVVVDEEMAAEDYDVVEAGLPVIPDSYGTNSAIDSGYGVPVWYGSAEFEALGDPDAAYDQGYDDEMDESLGERHRGSHKQSLKDRRDEAAAMDKKYGMKRKYDDVSTMDSESRWRDSRGRFQSKRSRRNQEFGDEVARQMRGYYRTGVLGSTQPVGEDVSRRNQDARRDYYTKPAVQNPNTGRWHKGPNYRQAHKIAKGVAWDRVERLGLAAEAEVLVAESRFDKLADKIAAQYEKKGMEPGRAMDIGRRTAYTIGAKKYGRKGMAAKARAGMRKAKAAEGLADYNYQSNVGDIDSPAFTEGTVNPMTFTRLGAYDVPVVGNDFGQDSSVMGYGVPEWYGADTFGADRMVDSFEEAAPPKLSVKKMGVMAAVVGTIAGIWYAKK